MLLETLISAASAIAGLALGSWLGRRPKPYCTCRHGYGTHDQGGPCAAQIERQLYNRSNNKAGIEYMQCPCKYYDGPAPPAQTFPAYVPWPK